MIKKKTRRFLGEKKGWGYPVIWGFFIRHIFFGIPINPTRKNHGMSGVKGFERNAQVITWGDPTAGGDSSQVGSRFFEPDVRV